MTDAKLEELKRVYVKAIMGRREARKALIKAEQVYDEAGGVYSEAIQQAAAAGGE